jgi:hypothetical protein
VNKESAQYLGLLERRLGLLDGLSKALVDSRGDFISLDMEAVHKRISEQEQFCRQIQSLDTEITRAQVHCAEASRAKPCANAIFWPGSPDEEAATSDRIRAAMERVAAAQSELKRLNNAHQAMLRRSRRTVNALLNLFQSYAPTYSEPAAPPVGMIYEERV